MPQPSVLTETLGKYTITATETGYAIVTTDGTPVVEQKDEIVHDSKTEGTFITPKTHCTKTNMQRALLRAQQIMEEEEEIKAAREALASNDGVVPWEEAKKDLGI